MNAGGKRKWKGVKPKGTERLRVERMRISVGFEVGGLRI